MNGRRNSGCKIRTRANGLTVSLETTFHNYQQKIATIGFWKLLRNADCYVRVGKFWGMPNERISEAYYFL